MNSKVRTAGEFTAVIILLIICLWFFLINFNPEEITSTAIVSGILLLLNIIWGTISLIRYKM